ncbi:MAG: CRISPR-associated endonuclease Cas2, partial [Thermoplasmata archaeon]
MGYRTKYIIVAYDIKKDYIRNDISDLLKYHGLKRFQYSVFVGNINEKYISELKNELEDYD